MTPKFVCACGNTEPSRFSVQEDRTVWLAARWSTDAEGNPVFVGSGDLKEEMTHSASLYCDVCNVTVQEIDQ